MRKLQHFDAITKNIITHTPERIPNWLRPAAELFSFFTNWEFSREMEVV